MPAAARSARAGSALPSPASARAGNAVGQPVLRVDGAVVFASGQCFQGGRAGFHIVAAERVVVRVAEEKPARLTRLPPPSAASPTKSARRIASSTAGSPSAGVGKTQHAGDAAETARPHSFLAGHAGEQVGSRGEPLAGGQPGIGALGALAGPDQPLRRPRVARLLKVIGNGIRVGIGLGR